MKTLRFGAGALLLLTSCSGGQEVPAPPPPEAVPVSAHLVGAAGDGAWYRAAGTVRAVRRAELATRMMTRVETVRVRAGDRVRSGQILATFERGAVTAAGTQTRAGLDLATSHLRRMERLHADSAIPVAQLEAARSAFEQARGQADAATAELGYTTLTAPFDGVVTARNADPGDLAAPGQPILVVEDAGAREIVIGVPERIASGLVAGREVTVRIGAEGTAVAALIAAVVPSADPMSRTVEVRLTSRATLTPGLTAVAELPMGRGATAELIVPRRAIVDRGALTGVFLVAADSVARLRWIRLGRVQGDDVAVAAGLAAGDLVITDPASVRDGLRVRVTVLPEAPR